MSLSNIYASLSTLASARRNHRLYVLYDSGNSRLSSLALDSSRGLLYFADPAHGTVGVLSTDGSTGSLRLLISGVTEKPEAITVDCTNRHFMLITGIA